MGHSGDSKTDLAAAFIERWQKSGAAERANFQPFLAELCELLGVRPPDPAVPDESRNAYVFEKSVTFNYADGSTSAGRIDLYKRGYFVLEAKQGSDQERADQLGLFAGPAKKSKKGAAVRGTAAWDDAMVRARGQAEAYAKALPPEGATLTAKEKDIHEKGLVSVLKQIHDDLDAAVSAAYGWPPTLSDEEILERLVALNKERAAEERRGLVRWLRPEFQAPRRPHRRRRSRPRLQGRSQGARRRGAGNAGRFRASAICRRSICDCLIYLMLLDRCSRSGTLSRRSTAKWQVDISVRLPTPHCSRSVVTSSTHPGSAARRAFKRTTRNSEDV